MGTKSHLAAKGKYTYGTGGGPYDAASFVREPFAVHSVPWGISVAGPAEPWKRTEIWVTAVRVGWEQARPRDGELRAAFGWDDGMPSVREHDEVVFIADTAKLEPGPGSGYRRFALAGESGVVVHVHTAPRVAYVVEITDDTGTTVALVTALRMRSIASVLDIERRIGSRVRGPDMPPDMCPEYSGALAGILGRGGDEIF